MVKASELKSFVFLWQYENNVHCIPQVSWQGWMQVKEEPTTGGPVLEVGIGVAHRQGQHKQIQNRKEASRTKK